MCNGPLHKHPVRNSPPPARASTRSQVCVGVLCVVARAGSGGCKGGLCGKGSAALPLPHRHRSQQGRSEVTPGKMGDRKGFLSLFYQPAVFNWEKKKLQ